MLKYGMKIGSVGIEFGDRAARDKALLTFCAGSTVEISSYGIRFQPSEGTFSTYEREGNEVMVTCTKCRALFTIDSAPQRMYPKLDYTKKWVEEEGHICDGCMAMATKAKAVADAKKVIDTSNETA